MNDSRVFIWLKVESVFSKLKQGDIFTPIDLEDSAKAAGITKETLLFVHNKVEGNGLTQLATRPVGQLVGVQL